MISELMQDLMEQHSTFYSLLVKHCTLQMLEIQELFCTKRILSAFSFQETINQIRKMKNEEF